MLAAALLLATASTPAHAADCGPWGCPGEQPRLSTPVPAAAPDGAFATADFDHDGVPNARDNCLLVPNPDQQPARRPAGVVVDPLAKEWRAAHPRAAFRTANELGEACSDWNGNWHRSEEAQILAPEPIKHQLYRYLADGGPMFGPDTLVYGGPVCSDLNDWPHMGEFAFTPSQFDRQQADFPMPAEQFGCPDGSFTRPGSAFVAQHMWGGKRLFTPTNAGGEITNRFFPSVSENPVWTPMLPWAPSAWFPHQHPQTVLGHVLRGRSFVDGRQTIVLDWRANTGANFGGFPVSNAAMPGMGSYLVYDECRGLQQGVWTCLATADIVRPSGERRLFQFGWMMFQSLNPDIAAWQQWEQQNPAWATPAAYGYAAS